MATRALVLGGGGIAGIAWESGIIAGLADSGIQLNQADKVIGTSAGSIVGSAVTNKQNMKTYYTQMAQASGQQDQSLSAIDIMELFGQAATGSSAEEIGRNFGRITQSRQPVISNEDRDERIKQLVGSFDWTDALHISALDIESGKAQLFNKESNVDLWQAVAASSAVPGIWGSVRLNGKDWIDGGLTSANNVQFAEDCDQIVVIAMIDQAQGNLPDVYAEISQLKEDSNVTLITPDEASRQLIVNAFDSSLAQAIGDAGYAQGLKLAEQNETLRQYWSNK